MGALSVTGQPKYRQGFGPLVAGVTFIPFGDLEAARAAITDKTCALISEPIQAEGGINLPPPGYLQELRRLCTERGALLIFDEIQTGVGRTGTFYAYEKEGAVPDVLTLAKGLAGGSRWGRCRRRGGGPGLRAGHPRLHLRRQPARLGRGALSANRHRRPQALQRCQDTGAYLGSALLRMSERRRPRTRGARGRGLLQGLVVEGEAAPIVAKARERGLLLSVAGGNVVRFAPALTVSRAELDEALEILAATLSEA